MPENPPHSGETVVASGSASVETVLESRDDAPFRANQIILDYDGSAASTIEIHESPDGTGSGSLDGTTLRKTVHLNAQGRVVLDNLMMRDFNTDVLVNPDGNTDGDLAVYADGADILSSRS